MTNKFKPVLNIPKTYEQFVLEDKQFDELINNSYQEEYGAEVNQGPQYGPGKKEFKEFAIKIKDSLGVNTITGRISCSSDAYQPGKNYAGVVVYAINGQFIWMNSGGDTQGRRGRSFYVIIKCTDGWPWEEVRKHPGIVHGYLIYKALGIDLRESNNIKKVCAGGFAWMPNKTPSLRFNSITLNTASNDVCQSDSNGELSPEEKRVVMYCWDQYASKGTGHTFEMPFMNDWVAGGGN